MKPFPAIAAALTVVLTCVAPVCAQASPDYVIPNAPFDEAAAARQLAPGGPATLRGKVVRTRGRMIFKREEQTAAVGTEIVLWPYTAHFEEFLALRKKHKDGRKRVFLSPEAFAYRIVARITGEGGTFEIPGLQPGKYYMEHRLHYTGSNVRDVPVGTQTVFSNQGIVGQHTIYAQERYYFPTSQLSSAIITINPGDTLVQAQID
jgi:hypothetical protein